MPRAIWSGSISFGLVNAPVRMFAAIDEHKLELHLVHVKDGSRIGYQKVCKKEEKPVPDDEIAKAYEVKGGDLVYLEDEDFEAAQVEGYKAIEILDFVPYEQIDPIYFERTYYLGPQEGAEKVYALLLKALAESGLAAIAQYVFHERQQLGCLRVRDGVFALEKMHYADEVRPVEGIRPKKSARVDKRELDTALRLVESLSGDFKPEKYDDEYRKRLLEVVKAKRKGKEVHRAAPEEPEEPTDLLAALRESIERHSQPGRRNGRRRDGLEAMSAAELNERARKLDISGRSKMTKAELVDAIREAA
jgi:DNA end-binding protein Ku